MRTEQEIQEELDFRWNIVNVAININKRRESKGQPPQYSADDLFLLGQILALAWVLESIPKLYLRPKEIVL